MSKIKNKMINVCVRVRENAVFLKISKGKCTFLKIFEK